MGLVQVDKSIVTSAVTSVALNGITTDDIYMIAINNFDSGQNNDNIYLRVNKSSSAQTDSEYDYSFQNLSCTNAISDRNASNQDKILLFENISAGGGNGIFYLYNFNSSSEFSYGNSQNVMNISNQNQGANGGWVHTIASASNGVTILGTGTNNLTGQFVLYKVVS